MNIWSKIFNKHHYHLELWTNCWLVGVCADVQYICIRPCIRSTKSWMNYAYSIIYCIFIASYRLRNTDAWNLIGWSWQPLCSCGRNHILRCNLPLLSTQNQFIRFIGHVMEYGVVAKQHSIVKPASSPMFATPAMLTHIHIESMRWNLWIIHWILQNYPAETEFSTLFGL